MEATIPAAAARSRSASLTHWKCSIRCGSAVRAAGAQQIERPAHRRVTDRVHRGGEPRVGPRADRQRRLGLAGDGQAAVAAAAVGLQHPGGAAPEAAVQKQLHASDAKPIRSHAAPDALPDQRGQRGHRRMKQDAEPQAIPRFEPAERVQDRVALHVVDACEPQAVRLHLPVSQRRVQHVRRGIGEMRPHQLDRPLEQHTGRLSDGVPHDQSAGRVEGVPGDPGNGQRRAVHPGGVDIQGIEINRRRLNGVEGRPVRRVGPVVGVPPLSDDPALHGNRRTDASRRLIPRPRSGQLHAAAPQGPHREMRVGIHEARGDDRIGQVVGRDVARGLTVELRRVADRPNAAVLPPDGVTNVTPGRATSPGARAADQPAGNGSESCRQKRPRGAFHMLKTQPSEYLDRASKMRK